MALVISFNKLVIGGVSEAECNRNFNTLEDVMELIDNDEEAILDSVDGLAGLVSDYKIVSDEKLDEMEIENEKMSSLRAKIRTLELEKKNAAINSITIKLDGTEELKICTRCNAGTFHRDGKCIKCEPTHPYLHILQALAGCESMEEFNRLKPIVLQASNHLLNAKVLD